MNEENFSQNQNLNPNPSFPQGQNPPPFEPQREEPFSPPPSNIFIRTSESDLENVQKEGGAFNQPVSEFKSPEPPKPEEVSFAPSQQFERPQEPTPFISPQGQQANIPSEVPVSEISSFTPPPSSKKKFLPFIIIGVLIILGAALGYFVIWPKIFAPKKVVQVTPTTSITITTTTTTTTLPPSPYVSLGVPYEKFNLSVDITGSVVLNAIKSAAKETMSPSGTFKVIIPKVHNDILSSKEVIYSLIPKLPENLKPYILEKHFLLYAYYGEVNPSLGLIVEIGDGAKEMVKPIFLNWEKKLQILKDLNNFYLIKTPSQVGKAFKDSNNLGAEIRTFDYKGEEVDLSYAFFDKYLIISSSLESVNAALERLQKPLQPIYP